MSIHASRNSIALGDPGCDRRTRRAGALPRTTALREPAGKPAARDTGERAGAKLAGSAQILRRWSVAELIAQATWREEIA